MQLQHELPNVCAERTRVSEIATAQARYRIFIASNRVILTKQDEFCRSGNKSSANQNGSQGICPKSDSNDTDTKLFTKRRKVKRNTSFAEDTTSLNGLRKESQIRPMNIESSGLMFSRKENHGFNAK